MAVEFWFSRTLRAVVPVSNVSMALIVLEIRGG